MLEHLRAGQCYEFKGVKNWRLASYRKWKKVDCQADPQSERIGSRRLYFSDGDVTGFDVTVYRCSDGKFRAQHASSSGV